MRLGLIAGITLALSASNLAAETLPLPADLIALHSPAGAELLSIAEARHDFLPLTIHFVTQVNTAFCGPATIAMLLNALEVPRPPSEATDGRGLFDQDNIFTAAMEAVKPRAEVATSGMSLREFTRALEAHGLTVEMHHASRTGLAGFRRLARRALETEGRFVAVNYLRSAIDQETGGHISPLAAYDAETDRFLVLDVARYKYPPVWVRAEALFDAMNTQAGRVTRGFVIVGR